MPHGRLRRNRDGGCGKLRWPRHEPRIVTKPLPDYLSPGLDLVLVGINPGLRSAERGHHFAGPGNRFWDLLFDAGLVPRKLGYEEDFRLPEYGIGLTNIVPRASRGSSDLRPADYARGRVALLQKIERCRPRAIAFVGVTVYRQLWPAIADGPVPTPLTCGRRSERIGELESALFVLPNPSGRNAHFTYDEMLSYWRELATWLENHA